MTHPFLENISEYFNLFWLKLKVVNRNFNDFCKVVLRYYSNANFRKCDLYLLSQYLFHNPYKISKQYLLQKGAPDPDIYGETPLTSLQEISKRCQLKRDDAVFELGSGRGRTCFWLNCILGCRVVGIEQIPKFVEKANKVKDRYGVQGVEFRLGDMLDANYDGATVIYLYGTCLEDSFIRDLAKNFAKLPSGTKIITVSYPLTDYEEEPVFEVMNRFPVQFTWGEGDVYLQVRK